MSSISFKWQGSQVCGALLCLIASAACSGSSESAAQPGTGDVGTTDVSKPDDEQQPIGIARVRRPTLTDCFNVRSSHDGSADYHTLWTYDTEDRRLSQVPTDDAGTPNDSSDPRQSQALYWVLDAANQVVVYAGGGSGFRPFRSNTQRDEQENPVAYRAAYFDQLDLNDEDAGQQYASGQYANEYDAAGQLVRQTAQFDVPAVTRTTTFEPDAEGRCGVITRDDGSVERRDYDADGRVSHRILTGMRRGNAPGTFDSTLSYERDERGRLTSVTEVYVGEEATPIQRLHLDYRQDGSVVSENRIETDVGDGYYRFDWSTGCSELLPLMIREPSSRCEADIDVPGGFWMP